MTPAIDNTKAPEFGLNSTLGLTQNEYYWIRHPEGTRFIAKLEANCWYTVGCQWAINVTRDQVICMVKAPEN
jgi:hypothetical protein